MTQVAHLAESGNAESRLNTAQVNLVGNAWRSRVHSCRRVETGAFLLLAVIPSFLIHLQNQLWNSAFHTEDTSTEPVWFTYQLSQCQCQCKFI